MTHRPVPVWQPPVGTTALIFDCDGTLADTMPVHYVAWLAMLAEHGLRFPEDQFYGLAGMPTAGIIRVLADEQGVPIADAEIPSMVIDKENRYIDMIDTVGPIGTVLGVAAAYRGVLPIAVASGGEHRIVDKTLAAIGAIGWFDTVVGAEDTERHKPEPDVFLEAAHRLGAAPAGCVVFEDSDLGLEAAERAGMLGVDVRRSPFR